MKQVYYYIFFIFFLSVDAIAQNVNYQVQVRYLGWNGRGDQAFSTPEYTFMAWARDNVDGSETGGQCFFSGNDFAGGGSNGSVSTGAGGTLFGTGTSIRNVSNTSATAIYLHGRAWEKDCDNNCSYKSSCYLGTIGDDDYADCSTLQTINFRNLPPCQWNDYGVVQCGTFYFAVRIYWESLLPTITLQPDATSNNYSLCKGTPLTLTSASTVNASTGPAYTNFSDNYQWQISTQTACPGTTWTNISGANSANYTVAQIGGTRLYRVLVKSNCSGGFTSQTVTSNCVRVTYHAMTGVGIDDPPPAIQSSICGNTVLPGSTHLLGTLQPPAIGAVANLNGYTWTATAGVTLTTPTAFQTNVTFPTTAGTYTINLQYNDLCGTADATAPACIVTVGSPNCDYAYVCGSCAGNGNTTANGGPTNPYTNISYALNNFAGRTHIRVSGPIAKSTIVELQSGIVIEGGFTVSGGIWTKSSAATTTVTFSGTETISNDIAHTIGFRANGDDNWTLQDLTLVTSAASGKPLRATEDPTMQFGLAMARITM